MHPSKLCLVLFVLLFFRCQRTEKENKVGDIYNTIIAGKLENYDGRFHDNIIVLMVSDIVADDHSRLLSKIQPDGTFQFAIELDNSREILLKYKKFFHMLAQPGDSIYVALTIDSETERPLLDEFSGNYAQRNQWVHAYSEISEQIWNKNPLPRPHEVSFSEYFDALQVKKAEQDSLYTEFISERNIQDSLFFAWGHQVNRYHYAYRFFSYKAMNEMYNVSQAKKNNVEINLSAIPVDIEVERNLENILDTLLLYQKDMLISKSAYNFYDVFDTYFWSNAREFHKERYGGDNKYFNIARLEYLKENFDTDVKELMLSRYLYSMLFSVEHRDKPEQREELLALVEANLDEIHYSPFRESLMAYLTEKKAYHKRLETSSYASKSLDISQYPEGERFWHELLKAHPNKVLYVKLWAPWCGPCMSNWSSIKNLENKLADRPFAVINLCIDSRKEDWEKAIAKYNIAGDNYLLTRDQTNILKSSLSFSAIPHQMIIDKAGNIAQNDAIGPGRSDGTVSQRLIDQLMEIIQSQE